MGDKKALCEHFQSLTEYKRVRGKERVCKVCDEMGERNWHELRTCQTCGHTFCCDESPHQHATQHFKESSHPIISSAQPGEHWGWCYEHDLYVDFLPNVIGS